MGFCRTTTRPPPLAPDPRRLPNTRSARYPVAGETLTLVLSHPGMSRSRWALDPDLFRHLTISYHSSDAWKDGYFQSYPRAQEYVIQADNAASAWARNLITISQPWCVA